MQPSCAASCDKVYNETGGQGEKLEPLNDAEIQELSRNLSHGVPMATPVFDGASEEEIKQMLTLADLPTSGQTTCSTAVPASDSSARSRSATCTC